MHERTDEPILTASVGRAPLGFNRLVTTVNAPLPVRQVIQSKVCNDLKASNFHLKNINSITQVHAQKNNIEMTTI